MRYLLALLLITVSAQAVDVQWNFRDFTATPNTVRRVYITPVQTYNVSGTNIITGDRRTFTNDSSGVLIVSNIVADASYKVEFLGAYMQTTFTNTFAAGLTGFVNAKDHLAAPTNAAAVVAYSMVDADLRFTTPAEVTNIAQSVTPGGAATNVVWSAPGTNATGFTNGLLVTIGAEVSAASVAAKQHGSANLTNWSALATNVLAGAGQTEWPVSAITNAGSAAYSNAASFLTPAQVGTSAYSNAASFYLSSNPSNYIVIGDVPAQRTQWSVGDITNSGTAAYSNAADFLTPSSTINGTNLAGTITNNTTGTSAYAATSGTATNVQSAGSNYLATALSTNLLLNGIGVADTNWVLNLVANINQHYYFSSVTNALGVGVSTNCSTMINSPVAAAATNSIAVPTAGVYFLSRVSTNTVTRIEEGPIGLQTYIYVSGGALVQTVTAHPEMWIWFTNDTMVQIATSGAQVFTEGATPTIFNTTMNVATATNLPTGSHLLLRWYADAVANTPTWNFVIGGVYDSHISVNVPASSTTTGAGTTVTLLDCSTGLVQTTLSTRVANVFMKSNATYNAEIVANGITNTVGGALTWIDAQPIASTNWILRW